MSAEPGRVQAFLRTVLRRTWSPLCAVAWVVAADLLRIVQPQILIFGMPLLICLAGAIACLARIRRGAILAGLVSVGICVYAGYVTLLVVSM